MNERLTIQDLTDLLAAKHSMTKKDAEAFVKEFFLLIEQALENEKTVKIKGLGTFKLIDVDSRESVNVNTGERFQIKGHTKVSFSPDANLRDTINKPFAHFETVVLNENTILEDTPIEETEEEETGEEASAQAVLNEMGDDSETTVIEENEGTDDGLSEEEPIQEEQIASQPLAEESIEEPAITEESAIAQESTEQTSPKEPEEAITETDIEEKVEQLEDEEVPEEEVIINEQQAASIEEEKEEIRSQVEEYRKFAPLIQTGLYYRLSDPSKEEYAAWAFVSEDQKEVLLNVVMQEIHGNMTVNYVNLQGLKCSAVYRDTETGKTYNGAALMEAGIPMPVEMGEFKAYQMHLVGEE